MIGLRGALADGLRAGAVDDHGDDLFQRRAILAHERGVEQRQQYEGEPERAQPYRALTQDETQRHYRRAGDRQHHEERHGEERREGEVIIGHPLRP